MPTKAKKKEPETLYEKALDKFNDYTNVTGAILEDYMCGDNGMFIELSAADKNFCDALEEVLVEEVLNEKKVIAYLKENVDDVDHEDIINVLNEEQVLDWAVSKGYATIRVENLADKAKLEEFVTTQLYPNMNDADKYNL